MSGVGARYCHGSDYFHIILTLEGEASLSNLAFDQALRISGYALRAISLGSEKARGAGEKKNFISVRIDKKLPKVVLIYQVQSQIPLVRTFYYGEEIAKTLPSFIHPNEFIDGAVVSGTYKSETQDSHLAPLRESFHRGNAPAARRESISSA